MPTVCEVGYSTGRSGHRRKSWHNRYKLTRTQAQMLIHARTRHTHSHALCPGWFLPPVPALWPSTPQLCLTLPTASFLPNPVSCAGVFLDSPSCTHHRGEGGSICFSIFHTDFSSGLGGERAGLSPLQLGEARISGENENALSTSACSLPLLSSSCSPPCLGCTSRALSSCTPVPQAPLMRLQLH